MPEMKEASVRSVDQHAWQIELSLLVDLEAHWENLRKEESETMGKVVSSRPARVGSGSLKARKALREVLCEQ